MLKNRETAKKGNLVMQIKGRHREVRFSNGKGNFNLDFVKGGVLQPHASRADLAKMLKAANLTASSFDPKSKMLLADQPLPRFLIVHTRNMWGESAQGAVSHTPIIDNYYTKESRQMEEIQRAQDEARRQETEALKGRIREEGIVNEGSSGSGTGEQGKEKVKKNDEDLFDEIANSDEDFTEQEL